MSIRGRVEAVCAGDLDHRSLRVALLDVLRDVVSFDAHVWLLTDPETCVGSSPVADVPLLAELPNVIRMKYLTPDGRWTSLDPLRATRLPVWAERIGMADVVSIVFSDAHGQWGFLDLWRVSGRFTDREFGQLDEVNATLCTALRRSILATFGDASPNVNAQAAVILVDDDLHVRAQTPATDAYLRALLPTDSDRAPIPAAVLNVAAQLLAVEQGVDHHMSMARVPVGNKWITLAAARLQDDSIGGRGTVAVTIAPTTPAERTELYCNVSGLTEREADVVRTLVDGADSRMVAQRLAISEHTVQDHLKSIFAKTGSPTRRVLTARATGSA